MYLAKTRPWKPILNYLGACLLEIERRDLKLGDKFQLHGMHSTILTYATNSNISQRGQGNFSSTIGNQQLGVQSYFVPNAGNDNNTLKTTTFFSVDLSITYPKLEIKKE